MTSPREQASVPPAKELMACPECGSPDIEMVDGEMEEMNCSECGYDFPLTAAVWREVSPKDGA